MEQSAIAAKRYKQFKKEQRKESVKKKVASFLVKLAMAIVKLLQKARILRRRKVEAVAVQ